MAQKIEVLLAQCLKRLDLDFFFKDARVSSERKRALEDCKSGAY